MVLRERKTKKKKKYIGRENRISLAVKVKYKKTAEGGKTWVVVSVVVMVVGHGSSWSSCFFHFASSWQGGLVRGGGRRFFAVCGDDLCSSGAGMGGDGTIQVFFLLHFL